MRRTTLLYELMLIAIFFVVNGAYAQSECPAADGITGAGGDLVNYTVPADANTVTLTVKGADGGNTPEANGGEGATITATFPVCPECTVKPGSTITFALGGAGESSTDLGGAGGGGASVVFVDGVAYPLIIAGGGAGASETVGQGGQDEFNVAATLAGSGGTQNLSGAGGGGGGAIDTDGTNSDGGDGFAAPGAGVGGASLAGFISQGGDGGQKSSLGTSFPGRDGGIGGGGAGGDGRQSSFSSNTGGGGGGGGYLGGDAFAGQTGGGGGTSYTYPGNTSVTQLEGADGGGSQSDGSGSVCYTSNGAASSCDGSNQLLNSGFGDYGNIDQAGRDIYIDDSSICRESWAFTGSWENSAGNSEGALCTEAQFDADLGVGDTDSGTISQTVANICKSQEVKLCFEYDFTFAASADKEVVVTLGGQEYIRFYTPNPAAVDRLYEDGTDADDVTVINEGLNINKEPGDNLVGGQTYTVCITDYNYDGAIPAVVLLSFTSTNGGGGEEVVNVDNFTLTYSNIGAPQVKPDEELTETPSACAGTFDLTTLVETVPDGLVISYKDASGVAVTDPTSVGSGTYNICYTRDASNPVCSVTSGCLDEVCTEVNVSCTVITPIDLLYFQANAQNIDTELKWATASEENNSHFEIERSINGVNFEFLQRVNSHTADGYSEFELTYEYLDKAAAFVENEFHENIYYRIKQIDFDGQFSYTPTRLVNFSNVDVTAKIFPNPVPKGGQVIIQANQINVVTVYDVTGQLLMNIENENNAKSTSIDTSNLSRGVYFIQVNNNKKYKLIVN